PAVRTSSRPRLFSRPTPFSASLYSVLLNSPRPYSRRHGRQRRPGSVQRRVFSRDRRCRPLGRWSRRRVTAPTVPPGSTPPSTAACRPSASSCPLPTCPAAPQEKCSRPCAASPPRYTSSLITTSPRRSHDQPQLPRIQHHQHHSQLPIPTA